CLICNAHLALAKKGNVERHFKSVHKNYDEDFPIKTELRKKRVSELKSPDALFDNFKNKSEIIFAIQDMQLSGNSVTHWIESMSQDVSFQLNNGIKDITEMISSVKTFQEKIDLKQFPSMSEEVEKQKQTEGNLPSFEKYTSHLEIILAEFERRFADFKQLEPVATFISFPFMAVDVGEIAEQIRSVFNLDKADIKNEIITIQNYIQLKCRASDATFLALVNTTKYPEIKKVALCIKSLFGSTYLCESAFSSMKIVKSKYRSTMTDAHLNDCMRLALTKYTPNFNKLADDRQCQASH
ncbi:GTD2A protein, partial [Amia calva]|nr:GTD2A protein [Amia calva]